MKGMAKKVVECRCRGTVDSGQKDIESDNGRRKDRGRKGEGKVSLASACGAFIS